MPLAATVSFNDPTGAYSQYYGLLRSNTIAAAAMWGEYLATNTPLEVEIHFEEGIGLARGGSQTSVFVGTLNGIDVYQMGAAHEIITGIDPNGSAADINVWFTPSRFGDVWMNPTPADRNVPVPANQVDGLSVLVHEIGHGLGFTGWRDALNGTLSTPYQSVFDVFINNEAGVSYFSGDTAAGVYGRPVPLSLEHLYHYGNFGSLEGSDIHGVLNSRTTRGVEYDLAPLDIAFLTDLGLPVVGSSNLSGFEYLPGTAGDDVIEGRSGADALRAGVGNDRLIGGPGNDILIGGPGIDTAIYTASRAAYTIAQSASGYTVRLDSTAETDSLDVERLQFSDRNVALDLNSGGSAGNAVRLIGAAFDATYIPEYAGIGIRLFDQGFSMVQIAQAALDTPLFLSLAGSNSNTSFVNTVYSNIMGSLPSDSVRHSFVRMLQGSGGTMTQAELLAIASQSNENAANIGLVGLQQTGIEYV